MDSATLQDVLHGSAIPSDPSQATHRALAEHLDQTDPLARFRAEFHIPRKSDVIPPAAAAPSDADAPCIYLCGHSLGLQPKLTARLVTEELETWSRRGVLGHFAHPHARPWVTVDENVTGKLAGVVGAHTSEVAVMGTLTANIHLLFASFYTPTAQRHKILIEQKAFPSDHYAVASHLEWHGLSAKDSLVLISADDDVHRTDPTDPLLTTAHILRTIDKHAHDAALLFLPGVQYYTGQAFDIKTITAYAHSKGLVVGWDLAHAAGNIPLELHDWGVDFAAWCSYKYLNSGPGSISGIFVHDKHSSPTTTTTTTPASTPPSFRPRLSGWWGHDKSTRFTMDTTQPFRPLPGAPGYQLSNPSVLDTTAHLASLTLFAQATPTAIFTKSARLTSYLYHLLTSPALFGERGGSSSAPVFRIITPATPASRGAQLSIQFLGSGSRAQDTLDKVHAYLEQRGVVADKREPDVMRVAPAPLYVSFVDVWEFARVFREALGAVGGWVEGEGGK
ncbi:pyridoxal phosphate-dependent transferase [Peziza echinospora]|nr:pyridoxal phosphate-dependent transferase [Peziza echinospora]